MMIRMFIAVFMVIASTGFAAGLMVSPMEQYVRPGKPAIYETHNAMDRAIAVDIVAEEWTIIEAGEEQRTPTEDLVIFPTQFILKGHATKRVKVVTRARKPLDAEKAYRVTIRELPVTFDIPEDELNRVYMANAYRTSFYVLPNKKSQAVKLVDAKMNEKTITAHFQNHGTVHTYLFDPELTLELDDGTTQKVDDPEILKVINGQNMHANMTRIFIFNLTPINLNAKISGATLKLRHEEDGEWHTHRLL